MLAVTTCAKYWQAPCQVELDNWVNSIHSACAAAFARHRGKTGTLHLLQEEIYRLDKGIESDQKLKHMAELQVRSLALLICCLFKIKDRW